MVRLYHQQEKAVVRRKECIWKRIKDKKNWKEFVSQRKYFGQIVCGKVWKYHQDIFESCKNNYKETYKYANKLLFRKKETPLPSGKNTVIANNFNIFFTEKIENMDYLNKLPCELEDHLMLKSEYQTSARFKCFEPVTFKHIQKVISNLASKSCELDPMPTYFLNLTLMMLHLLFATLLTNPCLKEFFQII